MIAVVSPYPSDSQRGNSVSARRIAGHLAAMGHESRVWEMDEFVREGSPEDALVVLHARRSREAILAHDTRRKKGAPFVLVLPGSDLHLDIGLGGTAAAEVLDSMSRADHLVVAQQGSVAVVPERFRKKLHVIPKSVNLPLPPPDAKPPKDHFRALFLAHLRPVKEPQLLDPALALVPSTSRLRVHHYGVAEVEKLARWARNFSRDNKRYQWQGSVERGEIPRLLAECHLSLNLSSVEGGANAVAESLVAGTPILLSAIPANIGMVGEGYPGLFPAGDADAIARLFVEAEKQGTFADELRAATKERATHFTAAAEQSGWGRLFPPTSR